MPADFRHDPWTDTRQPIDIFNEIRFIPGTSPYTIRLQEIPQKDAPSSITLKLCDILTAAITTTGATSVLVQHGPWFTANDIILIDNEKMQVTAVSGGSQTTTLSAAISSTTATSITVASGTNVKTGHILKVDNEEMLVTAGGGTASLTVIRGYNETTAATHSSGAAVFVRNDLTVTRGYGGTTASTHNSGTILFNDAAFSEVQASPGASQFWPDYSAAVEDDPDWNTGLLQFNSADAGKRVAITYKGLGTLTAARLLGSPGDLVLTCSATPPLGTLKANGAAVDRYVYSALDTAIYCGDANNATAEWGYRATRADSPSANRSITGQYLVLPDYRGEFPRGWDDSRGADPSRSLWAVQSYAIQSHYHSLTLAFAEGSGRAPVNSTYSTTVASNIPTDSTGGSETRPRNLATLVCIRY
jgi:hypothetical protein